MIWSLAEHYLQNTLWFPRGNDWQIKIKREYMSEFWLPGNLYITFHYTLKVLSYETI